MKRILIDLTDLISWSGNHGGTQRVAYGIAKEYFLLKDNPKQAVEFMVFSTQDKVFYQSSFSEIYDRTEQQKKSAPNNVITQPTVSIRSHIKNRLRPYIPEPIRKNNLVRKVAITSISTSMRAGRKGKTMIRRYAARSKRATAFLGDPIKFNEEDTVLILGKPWDYPDMEKTLTIEKAKTKFKLVQVIYDLILPLRPQLHHPSLFKPYTQYMFEAIYASDLLLPISKSTDRDLKLFAQTLKLPIPKTKVIRLAEAIVESDAVDDIKPDARIQDKFIACIGTIEIRKNHILLYYVYKLAQELKIELPQLVIVGARGWLTGDFQYLVENDPEIKDKILILETINDPGLDWIYRNCLFSVYPSLYEGWGLPVAESLAYGKVAVSSDASSMPEIADDLVDYFSPYDTKQCLEVITKYLNPSELSRKESQIRDKYHSISWSYTYNQISKAADQLRYNS
jgi:glycosyltransferase involved in cell wall biosynthesis